MRDLIVDDFDERKMRIRPAALIAVSRGARTVMRSPIEGGVMKKRIAVIVVAVLTVLVGATLAFGGPGARLIKDDGVWVKPGSLDDGKGLRPQASITLEQAIASAQGAASGSLGQVDLEHYRTRLVYMVDVGSQEVRVDAANGNVVAISPRD
jgi:hypothetical protein